MLRKKPTQFLPSKLLKEATIHSHCLFDKSRLSDIWKMKLKQLNWLGKPMKNVRSSQPCTEFCTDFTKAQVLPCEYR